MTAPGMLEAPSVARGVLSDPEKLAADLRALLYL